MTDQAYRIWTEYLSEDVSVGEFDDGEIIIQYEDGSYHLSQTGYEAEISGTVMTQIMLLLDPPWRGIKA